MATDRVLNAVNFLIEAPNYASLISEMTRIVENWDTHPMRYGGHLMVLNPLLDVGVANRTAFERLVELIEDKRRVHPKMRRADYQRDLMRERRARMAKALELHERRYGHLKGAARAAETQAIQNRWARAKREFLAKEGATDWQSRNDATRRFWEQLDAQLDRNLRHEPSVAVVA